VRWVAVAALLVACARPQPQIDAAPLAGVVLTGISYQAVRAVSYDDGTIVRHDPKGGYSIGMLSPRDRGRLLELIKRPALSGRRKVEVEDVGLRDMGCYTFAVRPTGVVFVCDGFFGHADNPDLVRLTRRAAGDDVSELYDLLLESPLADRRPFVRSRATVCATAASCPELVSGCEWPSWLPKQRAVSVEGDRLHDLEDLLNKCHRTLGCIDHRLANAEEVRLYRPMGITIHDFIPGTEQLFPWLAHPDELCAAQ